MERKKRIMATRPEPIGDVSLLGPVTLLGGAKALGPSILDAYGAHRLTLAGLPIHAALRLIRAFSTLQNDPEGPLALGVSRRTIKRWRMAPRSKRLSRAQSERVWMLAETLAEAVRVLGSQAEVDRWLGSRQPALDHHRPIELLGTSVGARLVAAYLARAERGVYT